MGSRLGSFQYCQPVQNQPKSQILFHKNVSPRDLTIVSYNDFGYNGKGADAYWDLGTGCSYLSADTLFQSGGGRLRPPSFESRLLIWI